MLHVMLAKWVTAAVWMFGKEAAAGKKQFVRPLMRARAAVTTRESFQKHRERRHTTRKAIHKNNDSEGPKVSQKSSSSQTWNQES